VKMAMTAQLLWRLVDVAVGVVLAGFLAPLTLAVLPRGIQGPWALLVTALVTIGIVMLVRPRLVGAGRVRRT